MVVVVVRVAVRRHGVVNKKKALDESFVIRRAHTRRTYTCRLATNTFQHNNLTNMNIHIHIHTPRDHPYPHQAIICVCHGRLWVMTKPDYTTHG